MVDARRSSQDLLYSSSARQGRSARLGARARGGGVLKVVLQQRELRAAGVCVRAVAVREHAHAGDSRKGGLMLEVSLAKATGCFCV